MSDHKMKLPPASIYDVAAIETWLADQAKRGWLLEGFGLLGVRMARGAPVDCQYRLEPVDGPELIRDPDLRDYYTDAGWEFVCFTSNRFFRIWSSTRPDPVELHGDPEVEARAYRRLARVLYRACALTVLWVLAELYVMVAPRPGVLQGTLESLIYETPGTWRLFWLLLCGWLLAGAVSDARAVYRPRRRLRRGIPLDHTKLPGAWRTWGRGALLAVLTVLLVLSIWWRPVRTLSIQSDVPPVRLSAELGAEGKEPGGFIVTGRNLLARQTVWSVETPPDGGVADAVTVTKYVSLRLPFLAGPLLAELRSWWNPADTVALEDARFDELYYSRREDWQCLALRRDGRVLYVAAKVPDDLIDHLNDYAKDLPEAK